MLKIRLSRTGSKNHPSYRVVVAHDRSKLTGRPIDELGFYNPMEKRLLIDKQKTESWVAKGAHISPRVTKLLQKI